MLSDKRYAIKTTGNWANAYSRALLRNKASTENAQQILHALMPIALRDNGYSAQTYELAAEAFERLGNLTAATEFRAIAKDLAGSRTLATRKTIESALRMTEAFVG